MNIITDTHIAAEASPLLLAAFDCLSEGVLVFDGQDRLAFWNARLLELVPGLAADLAAGQHLDDVCEQLDTFDDGELVRQWRRGSDGNQVVIVRPLGLSGRRERELRNNQQRWRDIAESLADWIWECDARGTLTYVSQGFCRIEGVCCADEPHAQCAQRLVGERADWSAYLPVQHDRQAFRGLRIKACVGGRLRHFSISGKPVYDAEGTFIGFRGAGCDVTAQIQAKEQSERVNARLLDGIEHLSHGLAIFDEDDRLVICNSRFRKSIPQLAERIMPGVTFADLTRATAETWLADEAEIERWISEQMECHRLGLTHERRAPDGRWFLIKDMRVKDGSTIVTRTDITELKRREQAVRASEARFRAVFQHAAIGIAVVQPGGRITQANQALANMLGYRPHELERLRYSDLVHPDYLESEAKLARRLVDGEIDHYQKETRYLRRDGQVMWGRLTVSIVRGEGAERFGIVMIEDIDKRKRTEADLSTFRAVVEASAEAIAILSTDGQPSYINSAHEKLFGRNLAEASQVGYLRHYAMDSRAMIQREVLPALQRGDNWEGVLDAVDAEGRVFALWQRAGVVRDEQNRPRLYFAFMHDHTSQQQIQNELFKAKEAAEQANVAKTRFLAAASHDLRQPLQALSMFVAVLSNRRHSPEDAALIKRIEDSVTAVEVLLNGLLDVSKLEAGLVVPELSAFNVAPMIDRLAAEFEPQVAELGLALRAVRSHSVVKSDPALLERILRNLLSNAVRYTPKGRILFGCRRRGGILRVEIWDTGIGIPESQIKLIFREFHQLGNPGRDRRQGLGLGLAIVERLARLLGHAISVSSAPGKGSGFVVEVPLAKQPEIVAQPRQLSLGIKRGDLTVIIIEDEPDVLESTRLLLESWGHRVYGALDCAGALRLLPQIGKRPDLILADYRLQNGATGGQAIHRIRTRLKSVVPAIILTGDTAPERLRQAQASGHGLLHKPVQPLALRQMIDEVLSNTSKAPKPAASHQKLAPSRLGAP